METLSALLAIFMDFPHIGPVVRSFDISFDVSLNKFLNK